jgi:dienelactone hydrolase
VLAIPACATAQSRCNFKLKYACRFQEFVMIVRRRTFLSSSLAACVVSARAAQPAIAKAFNPNLGPYGVKIANHLVFRTGTPAKDLQLRVTSPDAAGRYPVVIFSHGASSSKDLYFRIVDYWASHGYIIIQPTHIESESLGFKFGSMKPNDILMSRVSDMQFVLNNLGLIAEHAGISDRIDADKIAVSGHSFGGWIALIMAGLPLKGPNGPERFGDPRVKALISFNGVGQMDRIANDLWSEVTVPVFASTGTSDPGAVGDGVVRPWRFRIGAYDFAGSKEKYAVSILNGDHYYGGLICRDGAGGKPDPEGLSYVNAASVIFMDAYLKGDSAAKAFLKSADLRPLTNDRAFLERTLL